MTPIEKNVIVVDEQGNEYEATYPKRAKGLVKNGRARFVAENKICLACPPNENLEDEKMSDITNVTAVETHDTQELTSKQVFEQINKIREDNAHIFDALRQLETVKSEVQHDSGAFGRAQGIADVVKCRETTNQRLLEFYERTFNNLYMQEQQAKKRSESESEDMDKRRKEYIFVGDEGGCAV